MKREDLLDDWDNHFDDGAEDELKFEELDFSGNQGKIETRKRLQRKLDQLQMDRDIDEYNHYFTKPNRSISHRRDKKLRED